MANSNHYQVPAAAPYTHEYRLINDGQGCAVIWRKLGGKKPGHWNLTEYFSKLPQALQGESIIRAHMGQDSE